jgi:hypothetical protein
VTEECRALVVRKPDDASERRQILDPVAHLPAPVVPLGIDGVGKEAAAKRECP